MRGRRSTILCPHCRLAAVTMTSRELSPLVREIYLQCINVDCGHRFVAHLGIVRTLVPSLHPSPTVSLPIVERRANDILVQRAADAAAPPPSPPPPSVGHTPAPPMLN